MRTPNRAYHRLAHPVDLRSGFDLYANPEPTSATLVKLALLRVDDCDVSAFAPYPGFQVWPYAGYSRDYFDGAHRVLKGGSWATRPWALRASFRNWYVPQTRQILAGFRLARTGLT